MLNGSEVIRVLGEYLYREAGLGTDEVAPRTALFTSGLLDSLQLLGLVAFIEDRFGVEVKPLDVSLETFDTLERIADYVARRTHRDE